VASNDDIERLNREAQEAARLVSEAAKWLEAADAEVKARAEVITRAKLVARGFTSGKPPAFLADKVLLETVAQLKGEAPPPKPAPHTRAPAMQRLAV
jgi:hypothetical protein